MKHHCSPHVPAFAVLIVKLVEKEDSNDSYIDDCFDDDGPDHLLLGCIPILLFVHSFNIQIEVFVLQLKAQHYERNGKVPELHQFPEAQVAERGPEPEDELH